MGKAEVELYYRLEAQVAYGEVTFVEDCFAQIRDEIEVDPEGCDSLFADYERMYKSVLEHLNCNAEKTWGKHTPPSSVSIKITPMEKEEFLKE
ncbi:MAG: hypothetical protein JXR25_13080 [Pontiellaceae bacterium]|nr:hypothetical protein [Pontiellaceae bacterium]MBN2785749.1 hypothetical protein [Pontiellaceae bacterium]